MNFFKPEDFDDDNGGYGPYADRHAKIANAILKERGVRVYGTTNCMVEAWTKGNHPSDTHQALLINIEKLPKTQECAHEGYHTQDISKFNCMKCGIKLKASWTPA